MVKLIIYDLSGKSCDELDNSAVQELSLCESRKKELENQIQVIKTT